MNIELEKFVNGLHKYLQEQLTPVVSRIRELESRETPAPEKGEPGEKGDTGECVTVDDVLPLLEELVEHNVSKLPAPEKGEPGEKGDTGPGVDMEELEELVEASVSKIPAPKNGEDGKSVDIEEVKTLLMALVDDIPVAKDGKNGEDGKSVEIEDLRSVIKSLIDEIPKAVDGINGKDGAPGRDALDIEILASVDFERSYPRGTYARSAGGVIRSYSQTEGKRGWEPVWCGIAKVEIEQKDFRNFSIKTILGDESIVEESFTIPAILDRGVYKTENEYSQGDATTFGGSLWIAQVDEPEGKPGISKDWRLAVKHGRNGRDGDKGQAGERGDAGKDGKDGRDLTQMDTKGDKW